MKSGIVFQHINSIEMGMNPMSAELDSGLRHDSFFIQLVSPRKIPG